MTERAPFLADPGDLPTLRAALGKLAAEGFDEKRVRERVGLDELGDLQWRTVPIHRAERLAERGPLALAIDLFLLQGSLTPGELDHLFAPAEQAALVRSGVLAIDAASGVRARASLFPIGERMIFSDHAWPELPHPGYDEVPWDQVMWIGLDSRHLARTTLRRPVRAALDLCTGSGIHALLASTHAERVLAVDINPRAANCTRFNAQLWSAGNIEVATGDLFAAVPDETFDLITANPPFVPSPLDTLRFRDGGRSGEDVLRRIVAGLPRFLAPGGVAQIVTELGEREGEPLFRRLREWLGGAPMDIHILRMSEHTAAKYAIGHAKGNEYQAFLDSIDDWAANLRAQGYARVVSAVISFAWSDRQSTPWDRTDQAPPPRRDAAAAIEAILRTERLLRRPDFEAAVRQSWLSRAGQIALLDAQMLGGTVPPHTKATLLGQPLAIEQLVDPVEREILLRLNGRMAMPEMIALFRDLGVNEAAVIGAVRSLLARQLIRIDGPPAMEATPR